MLDCPLSAVPQDCLRFVIVVFPDHTHYFFYLCVVRDSLLIFIGFVWCFAFLTQENNILVQNTKPLQTMGTTINNKSTTGEPETLLELS